MENINYDEVADVYEHRYKKSYKAMGIPRKLRNIEQKNSLKTILEVGCGTGHWLSTFEYDTHVIGIDASYGMLSKANTPESSYHLIQGRSDHLPIKKKSIDLIYCVNAIHHFDNPEQFIKDCKTILTQHGILVIISMNPHSSQDDWFIYDYFEGTLEKDLKRFPSPSDVEKWLFKAGFTEVSFEVGERLQNRIFGEDIFPIPKDYTSQLSLLTDKEYKTGVKRIQDFIDSSYSKNEIPEFNVDISLSMVTANVS